MNTRAQRYKAPQSATQGNAPLKDEEIDCEHSRPYPIGRELLHHDVEEGHDRGPGGTSKEH